MQAEMQLQTETPIQPDIETQTETPDIDTRPRWHLAKQIAFRFTFAYLLLYSLPFPLQHIPYVGGYISQYYFAFWQSIIPWVGKHILRIGYDVPVIFSGSGDKTYDWVQGFCFLSLAAIATAVWSLLDRKRFNYDKLFQWFTLYMRFVLAGWMIIYGAMKAIPVQMSPSITRLVQPYGDFSPMGVLWSFMGSSPAYTSITGSVELLGGILLIFPRTTILGAMVSFVAMLQVFILNMCYDVPVKLFSFNLVLMSVFLLAPHMKRMADVLVFNRPTEPVSVRPFFQRKWLNLSLLIFQIAFGLYIVGTQVYGSYQGYYTYGVGGPKPPIYGIWSVEEFKVNGEVRPPLLTDDIQWHRLVIPSQNFVTIQPMRGGPLQRYSLKLDMENKTMTMGKMDDPNWKADLAIEEPEPDHLKLAGDIEGRRTEIKLVRMDESQFLQKNRGFHWIQERPFNR